MNNQNQLEQQLVFGTRNAVAMMARIITIPEMADVLKKGYDDHSDAFLAFLLVPGVTSLLPGKILTVFSDSYCAKGETAGTAVNELLGCLDWTKDLSQLHNKIGASDLRTWDWPQLREVLEEDYAFIETYQACYVFDRSQIRREFET